MKKTLEQQQVEIKELKSILQEPDVKEKFPQHVQSVPSTSEGKFNTSIATLYFKPFNEFFAKLIIKYCNQLFQ